MESTAVATRRIWASFGDYDLAAQAVAAFIDHGVPKDAIHLIAQQLPAEYAQQDAADVKDHAESGITVTTGADAKVGAEKGAGVGLGVGVLAGLAALAVPGFGLVIGGGALAVALAGAAGATAAGALAGAVTGYLKDQGADETVIHRVTNRLSAGDIVVNVNVDADRLSESEAFSIIRKYEGEELATPVT